MKRWRVLVAVLAVLVLGLSAPLAMASGECLTMMAECEGPCGVSSCVLSSPMSEVNSDLVSFQVAITSPHVPRSAPDPPELPPKSRSLSA